MTKVVVLNKDQTIKVGNELARAHLTSKLIESGTAGCVRIKIRGIFIG